MVMVKVLPLFLLYLVSSKNVISTLLATLLQIRCEIVGMKIIIIKVVGIGIKS